MESREVVEGGTRTDQPYGGTWSSCGIGELYGIAGGNPALLIQALIKREVTNERGYSQYIFTDNFLNPGLGGPGLADLISTHKLGPIVMGPKCINKNTGREIAAWIWAPDRNAISAYFAKRS